MSLFGGAVLDELKAWILSWLHLEVKKVMADAEQAVASEAEAVLTDAVPVVPPAE